jgi:Uma2 family endonuclease
MSIIYPHDEILRIPPWVVDHESFRRWARSEEFPEKARVYYLNGEVWVEMSKEQLFSHNQVKQAFNRTLGNLVTEEDFGSYFPDGAFLSNAEEDFTCRPDGIFVAHGSLERGDVRLVEGAEHGFLELEGSPDMVLEVISDSSVEKDTVILRDLYWRAGIREYWLVDAREEKLEFDILRHTTKGYAATRKQGGWVKSAALGKSFQLTRRTNKIGNPAYSLAVR